MEKKINMTKFFEERRKKIANGQIKVHNCDWMSKVVSEGINQLESHPFVVSNRLLNFFCKNII